MKVIARIMQILALAVLPLMACASQKQSPRNDKPQQVSTIVMPLNPYGNSETVIPPIDSRTNELAQTGKSFHSVLKGAVNKYKEAEEDNIYKYINIEEAEVKNNENEAVKSNSVKEVFDFLDKLSFGNEEVKLHVAARKDNSIGDESYFYIGEEDRGGDKMLYEHLCAEPSAQGAWQIYLLYTSSSVMPVFWHGGYIVRDFIFDEADVYDIEAGYNDYRPLKAVDLREFSEAGLLLPEVKMSHDGREADVYCTYWNDWRGLVRDHLHISFLNNGKVELTHVKPQVLVEFDCGICF